MPLATLISEKTNKRIFVTFHFITWMAIFLLPTMVNHIDEHFFDPEHLVRMMFPPIVMCVIFYVNYLFIVPRYLMKAHLRKAFLLSAFTIICGLVALNGYMTIIDQIYPKETHKEWLDDHPEVCRECIRMYIEHEMHPNAKKEPVHADNIKVSKNWEQLGKQIINARDIHAPSAWDKVLFIVRDVLLYLLIVAFAILLRMAESWHDATKARQQAEIKQKEAELQNMRNQISPHFLLNTLNNIYALTAFNTEKAQKAILDLSGLLRHMLYDSQNVMVDIQKELNFLRNYIHLMELRQSDNVEVKTSTNINGGDHFLIAPLIFISLIENAFKHGVSADQKSFIHLNLVYNKEADTLTLDIENSNFPKNDKDKSGSGIGLEQVRKRLNLTYPNHYTWEQKVSDDNSIYTSHLVIKIDQKEEA